MRGAWIIAAALVAGGALAGPVCAGVYFTTGTLRPEFARPEDPDAQELWPLPKPFKDFHGEWGSYRAAPITTPPESALRRHYLRRAGELEARQAGGMLGLDDRINLGAYYIRLGEYKKAIVLLEPKEREGHFMLLANLATAHELAGGGGSPELAVRYRERALAAWPRMYAGWDTGLLNFYRKAEQYHLRLVTLRQDRARQQPGGRRELQLDNLFPRVHFVGPGGKYEVGGMAPAQWAEVPSDATSLVMQLLLWTPFDDGLLWMLGELLNASGDVVGAAEMMKAVVVKSPDQANPMWNASVPDELRRHYELVAAAAAQRRKFAEEVLALQDRYLNLKLQAALMPRGMGLGAGDLIQEASWTAVVKASEPPPPPETAPAPPAPPPETPKDWMPNWRQIAVGFGAGAIVAWLLGYQIRQARWSRG